MRALLALLAAAAFHEAGHLLAAKRFGIPLRKGGAGFFGVRLLFDFSRTTYGREAAVHLAGPCAGLIGAVLGVLFGAEGFTGASLLLTAVNLLPAEGMDGGGALRCLLASHAGADGEAGAERILSAVSISARIAVWFFAVRWALRGSGDLGALLFAVGLTVGAC